MTGGRLDILRGLLFVFLLLTGCNREATEARHPLTSQRPVEHGALAQVRAWVDPETGQLSAPPASEEPTSLLRGGAAEAAGLVVVPGKTAAGGVMVDLRGHFTYGLRASVSSEGRVSARCDSRDAMGDGN